MISIVKIELPAPGFDELRAEARAEGFAFIESLAEEWESGANRFQGAGEVLAGHIDAGKLVAVGGLNRDPFQFDAVVGRLRRIYVRREWRGRGIGEALVKALLAQAGKSFTRVRLRAENPAAARLYERFGFEPICDPSATHILPLGAAGASK